MITLILGYLFALQCRVDDFEARLKSEEVWMCVQKDSRTPASIRKKAYRPSYSRSRTSPNWNKNQRLMYKYLKRGSFKNADLNGDGKRDVIVSKDSKGFKKISISFLSNGKFNQISVYNPQGKLIRERVDSNMDGQVDYYYECKGQVCETRSNYVGARPHFVKRSIASNEGETVKVYKYNEKTNKLELKEEIKSKSEPYSFASDETEGQAACINCLEEKNFSNLMKLIKATESIDRNINKKDYKADFIDTGVGILVHKECGDFLEEIKLNPKNRFDENDRKNAKNDLSKNQNMYFNKEKGKEEYNQYLNQLSMKDVVIDTVVQGLSCMGDMHKGNGDRTKDGVYSGGATEVFGDENKVIRSHIPGLINLFTNYNKKELQNGVPKEQLKIFCGEGRRLQDMMADCRDSTGEEYKKCKSIFSSLGSTIRTDSDAVTTREYNGEIKTYDRPSITIHNMSKQSSIEELKATIFHEIIHNLGHIHHIKNDETEGRENDYAFLCQFACFSNAHRYQYGELNDFNFDVKRDSAMISCSDPEYDQRSDSDAMEISWKTLKGYVPND